MSSPLPLRERLTKRLKGKRKNVLFDLTGEELDCEESPSSNNSSNNNQHNIIDLTSTSTSNNSIKNKNVTKGGLKRKKKSSSATTAGATTIFRRRKSARTNKVIKPFTYVNWLDDNFVKSNIHNPKISNNENIKTWLDFVIAIGAISESIGQFSGDVLQRLHSQHSGLSVLLVVA